MKKEVKNSVSPSQTAPQAKALGSVTGVKDEPGTEADPPIKSDPDAPPIVNGENNVTNSNNNCDNSTPGTPGSGGCQGDGLGSGPGGQERDATTPSSLEDKKPVLTGSGPPSNCNTGLGNGTIKSENDFLDTFDSKDGGE